MKSSGTFLLAGLIIHLHTSHLFAKLMVPENIEPQNKHFVKMSNCIRDIIYRFYEGRKLVFLDSEIKDSFGEQLLISGINATVDIGNQSYGNDLNKMFILTPNIDSPNFIFYKHLISVEEKASFFLIVWPSKPFEYLKSYVSKVHGRFWKNSILRVASFITTNTGDFHIYTYFPYTDGNCKSASILQKVDECTADGYKNYYKFFSGIEKLKNFHKCSVSCYGNVQQPDSALRRNKNGTWTVEGNIVYLLNTLRDHYNLTIDIINKREWQHDWFYFNLSLSMLLDIYKNVPFDFGFGSFLIQRDKNIPEFELSFPSNPEYICWAIPVFAGKYPSFWRAYTCEFPFLAWGFLGLAIISATTLVVIENIMEGNHIGSVIVIKKLLRMTFSIITSMPKLKTNFVSMNLFVVQWLMWGLVVRCAYEASLGSIMTFPIKIQQIRSNQELLDQNFTVAGGVEMYKILKTVATNNTVLKRLTNKFEILPPSDAKEVLLHIFHKRNVAVLQPYRYTMTQSYKYARSLGVKFLAFAMEPCLIQTYAAPVLIRKGSIMSELLFNFIQRLFESGIIKYWRGKDEVQDKRIVPKPRVLNLYKIHGAFVLYFFGLTLAFAVLLTEVIYSKHFSKSKTTNLQIKK